MNTLVVCSGGLDSVTLAHKVAVEQRLIHLVSFDYGQRHRQELEFARACAARLRVAHDVVDITDIGRRLTGSALTDSVAVPDGVDILIDDDGPGIPAVERERVFQPFTRLDASRNPSRAIFGEPPPRKDPGAR